MATNPLTPRVNNIETGGTWKIGDVKQSFLTEAEFQAEHDDTWVLCDGRDVIGSDYAILKEGDAVTSHNIPDARGQFLRAKNNGRADGQEDPAGERALGNQVADKFGSHNHEGGAPYFGGDAGALIYGSAPASGSRLNSMQNATVGVTPLTNNRGDDETAPKNVTCNMYIKINREPSA